MLDKHQVMRERDTKVLYNALQSIDEVDDKILVVAFTNSLQKGKF